MQRFAMAVLITLKPDGATRLAQFRQQAAPLFAEYDLRVERLLKITAKGQVVGENRADQPDLVQLLSFPSAAHFKAYASDPRYLALAAQRDEGISRMIVLAGVPCDTAAIATPGAGEASTRLYGLGLIRFKAGGAARLDAFNLQAKALFARHGMHIEAMLDVQHVMTPIGAGAHADTARLVLFYLDDASALPGYVSDPEYRALAPLRDAGLEAYDFFLGSAVLAPGATPTATSTPAEPIEAEGELP